MNDILATMFRKNFLLDIFLKHQAIGSETMLRAMFDKLAHASIMRLNAQSMDKLYDLMVMAVKHQILMTRNPRQMIMVTLNHLDAMKDFASSDSVKADVHLAYELLLQVRNLSNSLPLLTNPTVLSELLQVIRRTDAIREVRDPQLFRRVSGQGVHVSDGSNSEQQRDVQLPADKQAGGRSKEAGDHKSLRFRRRGLRHVQIRAGNKLFLSGIRRGAGIGRRRQSRDKTRFKHVGSTLDKTTGG